MTTERIEFSTTFAISDDNNASSLRAALSVIDDLDFGVLFDATEQLPPPLSPSESPPPPSPQRPTNGSSTARLHPLMAPYKSRNRRKLEIQALRQQQSDLQRELAQTQQIRALATSSQDGDEPENLALGIAWEQLALRQRAQRALADQQNDALRESVGFQAKIAQQLLSKVRRALVNKSGLLPMVAADQVEFDWQSLSASDHLLKVDQLYAQVSAVFNNSRFASGRREFQDLNVQADGASGYIVHLNIALVLPFNVDRVADALWRHTVRMSSDERIYQFKDVASEPEAMVSLFASVARDASIREGCMQGQVATQWYTNDDTNEQFVVSSMLCDVLKNDGQPFGITGDGYLRCSQLHYGVPTASTMGPTSTSPLTQVYWHRRIHVRADETSTTALTFLSPDSVRTRVRNNVAWNLQTVENLLLAQHRKKRSGLLHGQPVAASDATCMRKLEPTATCSATQGNGSAGGSTGVVDPLRWWCGW